MRICLRDHVEDAVYAVAAKFGEAVLLQTSPDEEVVIFFTDEAALQEGAQLIEVIGQELSTPLELEEINHNSWDPALRVPVTDATRLHWNMIRAQNGELDRLKSWD